MTTVTTIEDVERALEALSLPEWVRATEVHHVTDEFGDPALRVIVVLSDDAPPSSDRAVYRPLRNALRNALTGAYPNMWSHLVFRSESEQTELDESAGAQG